MRAKYDTFGVAGSGKLVKTTNAILEAGADELESSEDCEPFQSHVRIFSNVA